MEQITGELALWACLQWEQWFKPLFFSPPASFQPDFHKYLLHLVNLIYEAKFSVWLAGNVCVLFLLEAEMIQNQKGVHFHAWSFPWCKRQRVGGGCLVCPGTNQMCWSCVSLEANKEGAAKEQTIAGVGAFTWAKEGLGFSPMRVRLKSTAWAAAECQEPAGQSSALSKSFESVIPSRAKGQMLSPSLWMCVELHGSDWQMHRLSRCWCCWGFLLSDTKCQPVVGETTSDKD